MFEVSNYLIKGISLRIYTRGGDKGETSLFDGTKVSKDSLRVEAYGTIDELNSLLGVVKLYARGPLAGVVTELQRDLFKVAAELASPGKGSNAIPVVRHERIEELEHHINDFMGQLPPIRRFILPGGCEAASFLHLTRTVCRRAERLVVTLSHHEEVRSELIKYMNRLSDLLYAMARLANQMDGVEEIQWRGKEEETSL